MLQKLKSMKVSEVMTRPVMCTSPDTPAHDILEKLNRSNISGMPVVEGTTLIGIVTETDILKLFIQGKNLRSALASEFMTRNVITAEQDSLMLSAIKAFLDNQIHHLPITHKEKLVGIIFQHDLIKNIMDGAAEFALIS
jgi:CBS domain-containing protein